MIGVRVTHRGTKSRKEQIHVREKAFHRYFKEAKLRRWPMSEIRFERSQIGHEDGRHRRLGGPT